MCLYFMTSFMWGGRGGGSGEGEMVERGGGGKREGEGREGERWWRGEMGREGERGGGGDGHLFFSFPPTSVVCPNSWKISVDVNFTVDSSYL